MKLMLIACVAVALTVACTPMAWRVDCASTQLRDLDRRYTDELYDLRMSGVCGDGPTDNMTECPAYHQLWRSYWAARRELDRCGPQGTVRS